MRRLALALLVLASGCATSTVRYSSNPIGKAQFIGVAVTDDVAKAQRIASTYYRDLIGYPVYFRTDYRQLQPAGRGGFSVSWQGKQAGGRTWTSGLHEAMGLTGQDEPFVVLVLDRQGRVRGFSSWLGGAAQSSVDPVDELNGLVEDLLLNREGREEIVHHGKEVGGKGIVGLGSKTLVGTDDPADFYFQTDLKRRLIEEARGREAAGVLRQPFFALLGRPLPDWQVTDASGATVPLRRLAAGRVTVLAVFVAANEFQLGGPQVGLSRLRDVHRDFGLGRAAPGRTFVQGARPD